MITNQRFRLPVQDVVKLEMPEGARLLAVGQRLVHMSPNSVDLWALVDTRAPLVTRTLYVCEEDQPLGPAEGLVYVGMTTLYSGSFVAHVYDTGREEPITDGH